MTSEELNQKIRKIKLDAFDLVAMSLKMDPKLTGYKTLEEMALGTIKSAKAEIETITRKWEKENPDV